MRGRIRSVKPELFQDEELWDLAERTGLPVLQGFEGLWCFADREGRFEWKPRTLKALILPYWSGDFAKLLDQLEAGRFVVKYSVDGRVYGYVRNFHKHQAVNHREPPSELPPPTADDIARACPGTPGGNGKGREWEGNGSGTDAPTGAPVAAQGRGVVYFDLKGWEPSEELIAEAAIAGLPREAFERRLKKLRLGPIGGTRGTFDRDDYVRQQFGDWRIWEETDRAKGAHQARHGPNQPNAGKTGFEILERKAS